MNEDRFERDDWYAPLERADKDVKKKKKGKRRSGPFWLILIAVLLVLALIISSSVFFSSYSKPGQDTEKPEEDLMPEDFKDFFDGFYTSITTEKANVNIPVYEYKDGFALELKAHKGEELTLQELYKKCAVSIVSIKATKGGSTGFSWGTGIIMSEDGLILTNTHVVNGFDSVKVTMYDDKEYDALLVGADMISDIALLKVYASDLPTAEFGESTELEVGEHVAAIGNPLSNSLSRTLTDGIISAIDRGVRYNGHTMTVLQTNTAINDGNSGGALFNMHGQVIGITNMKMISYYSNIEGIGFAIPSATVKSVTDALLDYGEYRGRCAIGITVGAIPKEVAEYYGLPNGLYISEVVKNSDAARKGVRESDILLAINSVEVKTSEEVLEMRNTMNVGDTMKLTIWRDGAIIEFNVVLMDRNDLDK